MAVWRHLSLLILTFCVVLNASAAPAVQIDGHRRRALSAPKLSAPKIPPKASPIKVTPVPTVKVAPTVKATTTAKAVTTAQVTTTVKVTTTAPATTTVKVTTTAPATTTVKVTTTAQATTTVKNPTTSASLPGQPSNSIASSTPIRNVTQSTTSVASSSSISVASSSSTSPTSSSTARNATSSITSAVTATSTSLGHNATASISSSSIFRNSTSSVTSTASAGNATSTSAPSNATTPAAVCARPTSSGTQTKRAVAAPLPTTEGAKIPNIFTVLLNPNVDTKAHLAKVQQLMDSTASCDTVNSTIDGTLPLNTLGIYSATLGPSMLALLQKNADVQSVEPDVVSLLDAPIHSVRKQGPVRRVFGLFGTFTNFEGTWNLFRVTQQGKVTPGAKGQGTSLQSDDWTFRQDKNSGQGVTVYVIDSGVAPHQDFGSRLQPGFNVIQGATDPKDTSDKFGHGTGVAGVIAGDLCGVAKAVNIVPIKITDGKDVSNYAIITGISQAITAAAGKGGVINISASMSPTKSMLDAVEKALALNLHVVTTSGNGVEDATKISHGINDCQNRVVSNAHLPVVMVGATDSTDAQTVFSNFGSCVDIFAPGEDILVPSNLDPTIFLPGKQGTSFAAPHVSGFLASAIAKSPGLDPATGKQQLLASTIGAVQLSANGAAAQTTNKFLQIPQK